jgi:hypothetical protein
LFYFAIAKFGPTTGRTQREREIPPNVEVRVKRIVLESQADITGERLERFDILTTDTDLACIYRL